MNLRGSILLFMLSLENNGRKKNAKGWEQTFCVYNGGTESRQRVCQENREEGCEHNQTKNQEREVIWQRNQPRGMGNRFVIYEPMELPNR